jgi:heat shock protein HslJ
MRSALILLLVLINFSCQKDALMSAVPDVEGSWKFSGYKLSEEAPITRPCEQAAVTLNIASSADGYSITGTSFINTYFSKVSFAIDHTKRAGTIEMAAIGSTKMAGPENLMQCESNYYVNLKSINNFMLEGQTLYLFRDLSPQNPGNDSPILVFERN